MRRGPSIRGRHLPESKVWAISRSASTPLPKDVKSMTVAARESSGRTLARAHVATLSRARSSSNTAARAPQARVGGSPSSWRPHRLAAAGLRASVASCRKPASRCSLQVHPAGCASRVWAPVCCSGQRALPQQHGGGRPTGMRGDRSESAEGRVREGAVASRGADHGVHSWLVAVGVLQKSDDEPRTVVLTRRFPTSPAHS
jgi:hypothetical protein